MGIVVFLSLTVSALAAPVEIVGTLQNTDGVSLSGRITVIQESSSGVTFTHYEVDKTGLLEISIADAQGELVLHAAAPQHPSAEHVIPAGSDDGGGTAGQGGRWGCRYGGEVDR